MNESSDHDLSDVYEIDEHIQAKKIETIIIILNMMRKNSFPTVTRFKN